MIVAEKVHKKFGMNRALNNVSFEVEKGEIIGFLGRNGAGKTTLMRILTTYLSPSSGRVLINGKDIIKDSRAVRQMIGYLPEVPPVYPNMTVSEYLKFAAQLKNVPGRKLKFAVDQAIEQCDLTGVSQKVIGILSRGLKQRVGIAQAIINDPELLILDEPTIGLDPVQILQVRSLIQDLEQKRTVILSTHILSEIEQIAKRVLIINEGEILVDDTLDELLKYEDRKVTLEDYFLNLVSSVE